MKKATIALGFIVMSQSSFANDKVPSVNYILGDYYFPYVDKNKENQGCLTDFINKAFSSQGIEHQETIWLPWSIVLKSLLRQSDNSVSFPWAKTKEREKDYLYSQPLYTKNTYIWVLAKSAKKYHNIQSLKDTKVCIPSGYGVYGKTSQLIDKKQITRVTSLTMQGCFLQLKEEKVAAVYAGNDAVENFKAFDDKHSIFTRSFIAGHKTHYLVVSKKSPYAKQIIFTFNQGLDTLKKAGAPFNDKQCVTASQVN